MPRGIYRIEATRYHASLPPEVQRLDVGNKENFGVWGYKIENIETPSGRIYHSDNAEKLMKDLIINQIRADPEMRFKDRLVHVVLELNLESMPVESRQPNYRDPLEEHFCCTQQGED